VPYRATILVVCSANICRSPMAEHILRRLIENAGDSDRLRVLSAGTWAVSDESAADLTRQIMLEDGFDLSAHRSRAINQREIDNADLILVMTRGHKEDIITRFARAEGKTLLLTEMAGKPYDVNDPYNGSEEDYR